MSNTTVNKSGMSTVVVKEEKTDDEPSLSGSKLTREVMDNPRFHEGIKAKNSATQTIQEIHQNRLKRLRSEGLDYLKETEWKYKSIDKYIGQSTG